MFPGFDVSDWDAHLAWMWRWSNLRFVGFYLAHSASQRRTDWTGHWHDLRDLGWTLLPLWVPFSDKGIGGMLTADGDDHGHRAARLAVEAGLETGAAVYLDIEKPVFGGKDDRGYATYVVNWMTALRDAGFTPAVYCSRLDAPRFLDPHGPFAALAPKIWPFAIAGRTRATWDDQHHQLTPATADQWAVEKKDHSWSDNKAVTGCQYDWFNGQRSPADAAWPNADGGEAERRSFDWNSAYAFDPAHPTAAKAASLVVIGEAATAHVFVVSGSDVEHFELSGSGALGAGAPVAHSPADIGPDPPASASGFDAACTTAVCAAPDTADGFVLGQDGLIRTFWLHPGEEFPRHSWAVNPGSPARRGSPLASVSLTPGRIELFYVDRSNRLVTQSGDAAARNWTAAAPVADALAAGGSNIALVHLPAAADERDQLGLFFISLDYRQPMPAKPPDWDRAWQVVHCRHAAGAWTATPIGVLPAPAAVSGVAAARDGAGVLHVLVQSRSRDSVQHARLAPAAPEWRAGPMPPALPSDAEGHIWWMQLHLVPLGGTIVLLSVTSRGQLAWSALEEGGWSPISIIAVPFSAARPVACASDNANITVVGVTESGEVASRRFALSGESVVA